MARAEEFRDLARSYGFEAVAEACMADGFFEFMAERGDTLEAFEDEMRWLTWVTLSRYEAELV